ncbi:aliphatic sulfonate ABC transporter substrate-binding protein [Nocardiopsis sp. EMB25]|uniref:ABC transporter substrate-binding protein n=1 Tax=Nocardiopsis sp. EMB25 TaxID=2835867 RepID=UPI0022850334|nr:aliphatic sulfonate ABC transporter substrate-binding protein [Nocardiopsis sp. EMB25]MCY9783064.1 aliphatic sulfonate ABC transporter substrate-binding protein [Nocardiopsis sp. EMB25]
MRPPSRPTGVLAACLALAMAVTGCGALTEDDGPSLTLGYFPNVAHAPAMVGVERGTLADALGDGVDFDTRVFNAGPDAINAVFSGEVDVAFVGPNPAVNGWAQSEGQALRVIAGAASGGAGLVTRDDITSVDDLRGATVASPQLGNTQDVALRAFADEQGWDVDTAGGGDLSILPQPPAEIVDAFELGEIDGAWLPEPHLSRLLTRGDAHLLVDEADTWAETDGAFVTAHLVVGSEFLAREPDLVEDLLRGHLETVDWINAHPERARRVAGDHLEGLTGSRLSDEVTEAAFDRIAFTVDPVAPSLFTGAERAEAVGLLDPVDLTGIYALDPLDGLLAEDGRDPVSGLEG